MPVEHIICIYPTVTLRAASGFRSTWLHKPQVESWSAQAQFKLQLQPSTFLGAQKRMSLSNALERYHAAD